MGAPSPFHGFGRSGPGTTTTTSTINPNLAPTSLRRDPCDLWRIYKGRESSSARKAHLRSIRSGEAFEIQAVSKIPRLDITITFSDSDMKGCQHPYDDPLVIKAIAAKKTVHRVLVDKGSYSDIIFASTFDKMGIGRENLEPVNAYLHGFFGKRGLPLGSIQLVLTLGDPPC